MSQPSPSAQELAEPSFALLDTQYILQYEPSPAVIGPDADVEPDWKQLQPVGRPCCHSTTAAKPQCPPEICKPPADAHECCIQPEECSAVADKTKDSYLQHASSSQAGCGSVDDGKIAATKCCKAIEQAYRLNGAGIDVDGEEALTLEYQPVSKQHISSAQNVCMLNNSKDTAAIASVTSSSGKKSLTRNQTSRRERVWQNKRYRRDGVMDLWTRAGLQLQSTAT